jgi:hypothetical protein
LCYKGVERWVSFWEKGERDIQRCNVNINGASLNIQLRTDTLKSQVRKNAAADDESSISREFIRSGREVVSPQSSLFLGTRNVCIFVHLPLPPLTFVQE